MRGHLLKRNITIEESFSSAASYPHGLGSVPRSGMKVVWIHSRVEI